MTIKLGMLLLGSLLVYAGWTNKSVQALIFGDNTVQKGSSSWVPTSGGNAASTGSGSAGTAGGGSSSPSSTVPAASVSPNAGQVAKQSRDTTTLPWNQSGGFYINQPKYPSITINH